MKRETAAFGWSPKPQEVANMENVLAQLQRSNSNYFVKLLSMPSIQTRRGRKTATLLMPTQFAEENGYKIEKWIILRAHPSSGRPERPWAVRLRVTWSPEARSARLCGGFSDFVVGNGLMEGDFLIFVLQEDARSEFKVYMFRGSRGFPLYPEESDSASSDDEANNNRTSFPSPVHYHRVHKKAFTNNVKEEKATPSQCANHWQNHCGVPSFRKRLTASNICRSDRPRSKSGQFELPKGFMRTYGRLVQAAVKLQGIHEYSPTYIVTCRQKPGPKLRVDFLVTGWNRFVRENGLQKMDELHFSLMADSYFVVRKLS